MWITRKNIFTKFIFKNKCLGLFFNDSTEKKRTSDDVRFFEYDKFIS